jgi:hypothetical protein
MAIPEPVPLASYIDAKMGFGQTELGWPESASQKYSHGASISSGSLRG